MKRLIEFDVLRGVLLLMMIVDHSPSSLRRFTDQPLGFFTTAECFVFISAFLAGSALATCGLFAAGGLLHAETAPVPKGYTRPGPVTERGLAPGLQTKVIHQGPTRGGHLLDAFVWPTLELFFTALPATLIKKHDPETDLALFDLNATS
jgi:hypothetical protein